MIVVTRLNDSQFAVNPDLIERIHANPDTTLVMVDGAKYIVTESMDHVIELIAHYRARVIALARDLPQTGHAQLELVPPRDQSDHGQSDRGQPHRGGAADRAASPAPRHPRSN